MIKEPLRKVFKDWSINVYINPDKTYSVVISYFDINTIEEKVFKDFKQAKNTFKEIVKEGKNDKLRYTT